MRGTVEVRETIGLYPFEFSADDYDHPFDMDIYAIPFDAEGGLITEKAIYFNQAKQSFGHLVYPSDIEKSGNISYDAEDVVINLDSVDPDIMTIRIFMACYDTDGQYISIEDRTRLIEQGINVCSEDPHTFDSVVLAKYRVKFGDFIWQEQEIHVPPKTKVVQLVSLYRDSDSEWKIVRDIKPFQENINGVFAIYDNAVRTPSEESRKATSLRNYYRMCEESHFTKLISSL